MRMSQQHFPLPLVRKQMKTTVTISYPSKNQSIAIGVFAVTAILAAGFSIGFLTGVANVSTAEACCVIPPSPPPPPTCTLSALPGSITAGGSSVLSWTTSNATTLSINQSVGSVSPIVGGSTSVSPPDDTTYTLTATGDGSTITCTVPIDVTSGGGTPPPNIFLTQLTNLTAQPLALVYLSQIPYTGLDLGPIGTAVYWLVLLAWSGGIAYLILFKAIPTVALRLRVFGDSVKALLNAPAATEKSRDPLTAISMFAPKELVAELPRVEPAAVRYSPFEGFRSFAKEETLTVDDIVRGVSSLPVGELPTSFGGPELVPSFAAATVSDANASSNGDAHGFGNAMASMPTDVRGFIGALLKGDRPATFGALRSTARDGGSVEPFLTNVVCALDDAYRARVDGMPCDPEVERICSSCDTPLLERLVAALSTAIDSSYREGLTGAKLAVTRAFAALSK